MSVAAIPNAHERRHVPRVPFQRPARVRMDGREWPVRVLDLSLNGAFIALPRRCRTTAGERLTFEIDHADRTLSIEAIVVRVRGKRVGVRCVAMRSEVAEAIRDLVARELGQPELADRALAALS